MRVLLPALVLALLFLVGTPPSAYAHEGGIDHGSLFSDTLIPGGRLTRHLDFVDGPLLGGWVFLLGAKVQGGSLSAQLTIAGNTAGTWSIPETDRWVVTSVLPETGSYDLTLENSGAADVTFWIYFDQSCNCAGKFIPADIPDGMVIFNTDTSGPSTVVAQFNEPKAMKVRVTAALLARPGGVWPDDFESLGVSEQPVERQAGPYVPPVLLHELQVTVSKATRVYFFVEGIAFDAANYSTPADLLITPFYDVKESGEPGSLSPWIYIGIAAAFIVAGTTILWRGRRREEPRGKRESRRGKDVTRRGGERGRRRKQTSRNRRRRR